MAAELSVAAELCRWLCTAECTFGWKADGGSGKLMMQTFFPRLRAPLPEFALRLMMRIYNELNESLLNFGRLVLGYANAAFARDQHDLHAFSEPYLFPGFFLRFQNFCTALESKL